jgi:hypothetical protein
MSELDWRDLITRHLVGFGLVVCGFGSPWRQKQPAFCERCVSVCQSVVFLLGRGQSSVSRRVFDRDSVHAWNCHLSAQDARPRDPLEQLHLVGESGDVDAAQVLANKEVIMATIKKALRLPIPEPPGVHIH